MRTYIHTLCKSAVAVVFIFLLSSSSALAASVTPVTFEGGEGGNRTCSEIGLALYGNADYFEFSSDRVNYDGVFEGSFPEGLSVTTDGTYVDFNSTFGIGAVIVKGGNASNVYAYDPQVKNDTGLVSPNNPNGKPAGLSNITFCWNPEDVEEKPAQWCSPGYWRQAHHLGAWEATGISPKTAYALSPVITLSKKALKDGATATPTLWEVLQSPQWYGGAAFNAVGDLLSEAHPDVNFTGERVEDSCPLN